MNKIVEMPNWMLFQEGYGIQKDSYIDVLRKCDAVTLRACACVSKNWHEVVNAFMPISCPGLTVFNIASILPHIEEKQPSFNSLKVLEFVEKLGPKIENDASCTVMPVLKGTTVSSLCALAESVGMTVHTYENILSSVCTLVEEDTHCIAITNTLLENSRNLSYAERKPVLEKTMEEVGIDGRRPSVPELIAFNIFSFVNDKHFFADSFAESSFVIESGGLYSICVGRTAPDVILISLVWKGKNFGSALCKDV